MPKHKFLVLCALLGCAGSYTAAAEEPFDAGTVWTDTKLYFTAPVRWDATDWLYFGGTLVLIGVSHSFDGDVRNHFVGTSTGTSSSSSVRDAAPAAALVVGTFAFALIDHSPEGRVETYTMLEAAAFSGVTTEVLKYAAGRLRPNETTDVNAWREGGDSFPSLHVSAAFAIGTVFAESGNDDYRWIRRFFGYGVGLATMYNRLKGNDHWLSDTVTGAAIGISTAHFTMNRREARDTPGGRWSITPTSHGGAMLSYDLSFK